MSVSAARILIVDDDPIVREVTALYLSREGHSVQTAADGETALRLVQEGLPDLAVLDLMLPGIDGLDVAERLRETSPVPIIMLTARTEGIYKSRGTALGVDDYLVKPVSPRRLVARVEAALRRAQHPTSPGQLSMHFDGLIIDPRARMVEMQGRRVDLTPTEFNLLSFLASNSGQTFTAEQLLERVWDAGYLEDAGTVAVLVRRLRDKVEEYPIRPKHLKSVPGAGYRFDS